MNHMDNEYIIKPSEIIEMDKLMSEKKDWIYNENKSYEFYIGRKAYIMTKWDNSNELNILNYGKLQFINKDFVTVDCGTHKYKQFNNLKKTLTYSNNEIQCIFVKVSSDVSIKKEYNKIKNSNNISSSEKNFLYRRLFMCNFKCI